MKVGSLFSGIGGFDLGLERAGYEIAWQVEIDEYCRRVLRKHWPKVPCHADIKTIDWQTIPAVDLVCGGFPCQPFSCAGKQAGKDDDRYLWPEVVRCLSTVRPTWFIGENVPGIIHLGIKQVLVDLEALGYETNLFGIPAAAVDAPHQRQRIWILAYAKRGRVSIRRRTKSLIQEEINGGRISRDVASGMQQQETQILSDYKPVWELQPQGSQQDKRGRPSNGSRWLPEPAVGRVAHGVPNRVDRLRGLGNAIVPQIAEALGRMILEVEK